ncbi:hypothetical protein ABT168_21775 [Streptomyces sp. NPDC001793]|uniref:hypothetical protein n=1 Tax=Streptomyces sp. NPDC001793 TaxID=3154657 RepID=UPI00332FBE3C
MLVGLLFRLMWWIGGLSAVLALAVLVVLVVSSPAAVLLWKGRYPRHRFTGMVAFDRWAVQVLAYTFFLTDACPPLRPESAGRRAGGLRARLRGGLRHRPPRGPTPAVSAR